MAAVATDSLSTSSNPIITHTDYVQKRPLFSTKPVKYMHLSTKDDCVFIFNQEAGEDAFSTIKVMADASGAMCDTGITDDIVKMKFQEKEITAAGVEGAVRYMLWLERWRRVYVQKIEDWEDLKTMSQEQLQEVAIAASWLQD